MTDVIIETHLGDFFRNLLKNIGTEDIGKHAFLSHLQFS
jgi:hypothetical protein